MSLARNQLCKASARTKEPQGVHCNVVQVISEFGRLYLTVKRCMEYLLADAKHRPRVSFMLEWYIF